MTKVIKLGFEPRSFKIRSPSSFHYTLLDELMQKSGEKRKGKGRGGKRREG